MRLLTSNTKQRLVLEFMPDSLLDFGVCSKIDSLMVAKYQYLISRITYRGNLLQSLHPIQRFWRHEPKPWLD